MEFNTKIAIAVQLAQALVFLHIAQPPIVLLDVKPDNILVSWQYWLYSYFLPKLKKW